MIRLAVIENEVGCGVFFVHFLSVKGMETDTFQCSLLILMNFIDFQCVCVCLCCNLSGRKLICCFDWNESILFFLNQRGNSFFIIDFSRMDDLKFFCNTFFFCFSVVVVVRDGTYLLILLFLNYYIFLILKFFFKKKIPEINSVEVTIYYFRFFCCLWWNLWIFLS